MPNYYNPLNVTRTFAINQTPEQNAAMFDCVTKKTSTSTQQTVKCTTVTFGNSSTYLIPEGTPVFVTYPKGYKGPSTQ